MAAAAFGLIRGDRTVASCCCTGSPHSRACESNTFYMPVDEEESQLTAASQSFGVPLFLLASPSACVLASARPIGRVEPETSGDCSLQESQIKTKLLLLATKGVRSCRGGHHHLLSSVILCVQFVNWGCGTGNHTYSPEAGSHVSAASVYTNDPSTNQPDIFLQSPVFRKMGGAALTLPHFILMVLVFVLGACGTLCQTSWNSVTQLKVQPEGTRLRKRVGLSGDRTHPQTHL